MHRTTSTDVAPVVDSANSEFRNIAEVLAEASSTFPSRVAYGPQRVGITYSELKNNAVDIALRSRDTESRFLVVCGPNGPHVPAALFGAAWAGLTYAPLNPRLPRDSIDRFLAKLDRPLVVQPDSLERRVDSDSRSMEITNTDEPAALLFTSGTTAAPKAALLQHRHLLATAIRFAGPPASDDECLLLTAPSFHASSILLILGATYAGRRIVSIADGRFCARDWLDTVERERVTHASVVPTVLYRIVDELERRGGDVSSLKRLSYGSARMPLPIIEKALTLFPETGFVNNYGMTETAGAVTSLAAEDHRLAVHSRDPDIRRRLNSVGRPLPDVELKIAGPNGESLPTGEVGEIRIRGPQASGAYLEHPPKLDSQGWVCSGDQGWVDDAGFLYCLGRGDDTIIRGGENIAAAEIEDLLVRHRDVAEAVAVGLPDPEWGERIVAVLTVRPDFDGDTQLLTAQLIDWVRQQLGSLKTPEDAVVVDELPVTDTGKILRRKVRDSLLEPTER